jgi:hypothetical protein
MKRMPIWMMVPGLTHGAPAVCISLLNSPVGFAQSPMRNDDVETN